jgi:hypothetical protein
MIVGKWKQRLRKTSKDFSLCWFASNGLSTTLKIDKINLSKNMQQ